MPRHLKIAYVKVACTPYSRPHHVDQGFPQPHYSSRRLLARFNTIAGVFFSLSKIMKCLHLNSWRSEWHLTNWRDTRATASDQRNSSMRSQYVVLLKSVCLDNCDTKYRLHKWWDGNTQTECACTFHVRSGHEILNYSPTVFQHHKWRGPRNYNEIAIGKQMQHMVQVFDSKTARFGVKLVINTKKKQLLRSAPNCVSNVAQC